MVPADDQAIALPCTSVMVIMVLLNDAFTCATPELMFLRSRRRTRVASLPMLDPSQRAGALVWARAPRVGVTRLTSSCRRSAAPAPCGCARWYGYAVRAPAIRADAASRDSTPDPSAA